MKVGRQSRRIEPFTGAQRHSRFCSFSRESMKTNELDPVDDRVRGHGIRGEAFVCGTTDDFLRACEGRPYNEQPDKRHACRNANAHISLHQEKELLGWMKSFA